MREQTCTTPVLLSPWVTNTRCGLCSVMAASSWARLKAVPAGVDTLATVAPCRRAMSADLTPQIPAQISGYLEGQNIMEI